MKNTSRLNNTPTSGFDFYEFTLAHPILGGLFSGGIAFVGAMIPDPQVDRGQMPSIEWGIGFGVLGFLFGAGLFAFMGRRHRRAEEEWRRAEEECRSQQDQDAQGSE